MTYPKQTEWKKNHYKENKNLYIDKQRKRRQEMREWYNEIKGKLKCERCPENHIAAIEFHHLDPNIKDMELSRMIGQTSSKKRILDEINKCMVLCSNCHRKLHYDEKINENNDD